MSKQTAFLINTIPDTAITKSVQLIITLMNINGSRRVNLQTCPSCSSEVARKDMRWEEQYGGRAGNSRKGLDAFPSTGPDLDIFGARTLAYLLGERRPEGASGCNGWKWKIRGKWKCVWLPIMLWGQRQNRDFGNRKVEDELSCSRIDSTARAQSTWYLKIVKKKKSDHEFFSLGILFYMKFNENHAKFNQLIKRDRNWICK